MHLLADVVSKNGNLLLNVGPRADGQIPQVARDTLLAIGGWLKTNGEAIYGSRPWRVFGEGPTDTANGSFAESKAKPYTPRDFRFTTKPGLLYAIQLGRPDNSKLAIASIRRDTAVRRVSLLGSDAPVRFQQSDAGLMLTLPAGIAPQPANVYRLEI